VFSQLENYINQVDALGQEAFKAIKEQCNEQGKLNNRLLDNYQHLSYELAFCIAELRAASSHINYCNSLNAEEDSLEAQQAFYFGAEVIQQSKQRLFVYQNELGL